MPIELSQGFQFGAFTAEPLKGLVARDDEQSCHLAPKAMDVLVRLAEVAPEAVTRDDLITAVWGERYVSDEVLTHAIMEIRHALGDSTNQPQYIQTIPKRGYRLLKKTRPIDYPTSALKGRRRRYLVIAASLVLVSVVFSWFVMNLARNAEPTEAASAADEVTVSGITVKPLTRIAVLPFDDLSPDGDQEYFSDGISEEILNLLAQIESLKVIARHSAFSFKGQNVDIATIAAKLDVSYVLEGSARRSGGRVRIAAHLIDTQDSSQLWSEAFDRDYSAESLIDIQSEIALEVVEALKVMLLDVEEERLAQRYKTDPEAYAFYLQGRELWGRSQDADKARSETLLTRTIEIDPQFASGWAELAAVQWGRTSLYGHYSPEEGVKRARRSVEQALAIDSNNARALQVLATIQMGYEFDLVAASENLDRAGQLRPGDASIYRSQSRLNEALGRLDEAIAWAERSILLDPLSPNTHHQLGRMYFRANRLDEAMDSFKIALMLDPNHSRARSYTGRIQLAKGDAQAALESMQKIGEDLRPVGMALVHHSLGNSEESDRALAQWINMYGHLGQFIVASIYAYRGENDPAFEWLDAAYDARDSGLNSILLHPYFVTLHDDPRWERFLDKLGLPH